MEQTLKVSQALESLAAIPDIASKPEFAIVQQAVKKDLVTLGTDEAFALRDESGEIRAFKQTITLSLADKTLTQPVSGGDIVISAQGYEVWAEAAGANVIFPDQVLVGATWQPNPHAIMNEKNGRIGLVYARAVAFRFSAKGIPMVSDWTTIFDTAQYRMIDLIAKAKKWPQAFKLLPNGIEPDAEGTWGKYPFDEAMTLWVNSAHEEALQWYSQIINREKKSLDFAQSFAKRNATKHLSGLQKVNGPTVKIPVTCWRPTSGNIVKWDATQYVKLQQRVGKLIHAADKEFGSTQPLAITAGSEDVADEIGVDVIDTEIDQEDPAAADAAPAPAPENVLPADYEQVMESLNVIKVDPELRPLFLEQCKKMGISATEPIKYPRAKEILAALDS